MVTTRSLISPATAQQQTSATTVWEQTLGESSTDTLFNAVTEVEDGGYFFVGHRTHPENGVKYGYAAIIDSDGTLVHTADQPSPPANPYTITDVLSKGDGTYYLIGQHATDDGSYPAAAQVTLSEENGVERVWRDAGQDRGVARCGDITPDGGLAVVGQEWDSDTEQYVGVIAKFSPDGNQEWGEQIDTDGAGTVLYDVGYGDKIGYGFSGASLRETGPPQPVAGAIDEDGANPVSRVYSPPDGFDGAFFTAGEKALEVNDAAHVLVGEALTAEGESSAYAMGLDLEGKKTSDQVFGREADDTGFQDVIRNTDNQEYAFIGYRETGGGRDGWLTVYAADDNTHVADITRGGTGHDVFTSALDSDDFILAGRTESSDSEGTNGWALALTGNNDQSQQQGEENDVQSQEQEGGNKDTTVQPQQQDDGSGVNRGFFSNSGDSTLEPLGDPFVLTVGGFVLSVAGIVYQLVSGH